MYCPGDSPCNISFLLETWGLLSAAYNLVLAPGKQSVNSHLPSKKPGKLLQLRPPSPLSSAPSGSPAAPGSCGL